ncbi:RNA polymerase sigma factor [Singulisphaera rosea]
MADVPATRMSLLLRLRGPRDERAWAEFVAIYTPLIERVARSEGLQSADTEDVTQEVLRAVAGAIDRYDPDPSKGSFRGWLFRIARNLVINMLAARRFRPLVTGDSDVRDLLDALPVPDGAETAFFEGEYRRQMFLWAAGRVCTEFRQSTWKAFWSTGVEGADAKVVAEEVGISVGAVYIARSRVMARLRTVIEQAEADSAWEIPGGGP